VFDVKTGNWGGDGSGPGTTPFKNGALITQPGTKNRPAYNLQVKKGRPRAIKKRLKKRNRWGFLPTKSRFRGIPAHGTLEPIVGDAEYEGTKLGPYER